MDVKTAFLNGVVEEEVYVEKPLSFETHDKESHVCRLKKSLYGLKQTPRKWYDRINNFLSSLGFTKRKEESNMYYKIEEGNCHSRNGGTWSVTRKTQFRTKKPFLFDRGMCSHLIR